MSKRGETGPVPVVFRSDQFAGEKMIRIGLDARVDESIAADIASRELTSFAADLLQVCCSIYFLDRVISRPRHNTNISGNHWSRQISAKIPVVNVGDWKRASSNLEELLFWLTDDNWEISFFPASEQRAFGGSSHLFSLIGDGAEPALFSGGLDSTAGVAQFRAVRDLVPVSVATNTHMLGVQRKILQDLRTSGPSLHHMLFRVNLRSGWTLQEGVRGESSQRTRGLLFLAAGAASALTLGAKSLWFFENGIGALNLPYLRSQIGSQATRSAHPATIILMKELVRSLTQTDLEIRTPWVGKTKAQVISGTDAVDVSAIARSVSCDTSFSSRVRGHPSCGACTSCLLRLQAVAASNRPHLDQMKTFRAVPDALTPELIAMLWQVSRLSSALAVNSPLESLLMEFPELTSALNLVDGGIIVDLYQRYVDEWRELMRSLKLPIEAWISPPQERGTSS